MEDHLTVIEMRRQDSDRFDLRREFMSAGELVNLRTEVLRVTQDRLVEQLISPSTGVPIKRAAVSLWEKGRRPIPLWAARRIRNLAEAARRYDAQVEG